MTPPENLSPEPADGHSERLELPASRGAIKDLAEALQRFLPESDEDLPSEATAVPGDMQGNVEVAHFGKLPDGRVLWVSERSEPEVHRLHLKIIEKGGASGIQAETDVAIWAKPDGYEISPSVTELQTNQLVNPRAKIPELWEHSADALTSAAEAQLMEADLRSDGMSEQEVRELIAQVKTAEPFDPFG